jgi:hypothetical protein
MRLVMNSMILTETIFVNKKPVGVVRHCTQSNQFAFSPINGPSLIPAREWPNIDELKQAVFQVYKNDESPLD